MRSRRSNRGENSNGDGFSFSKFLNSITPHFKRKNKDGEISPNRKKRKNFNNGADGEVPLHQKVFQLIKQERQKHRFRPFDKSSKACAYYRNRPGII